MRPSVVAHSTSSMVILQGILKPYSRVLDSYKYIAAAFGDVIFQAPRRYLQTQITEQNGTTWSYLFTQNLNASSPTGVAHGSDVPYTFGAPSASPATYGAPAVQFSRQMVADW